MTENELRTIAASIVLCGQYAEGDSVNRDIMVEEAIKTTDALLEALCDIETLKKRITERSEKRRKGSAPPKRTTPTYAHQDFIDRVPEKDRGMYTPIPEAKA